MIAEVPLATEFPAIVDASEGVTFSGSISVMCIVPSALILSSRYFSTGPIIVSTPFHALSALVGEVRFEGPYILSVNMQ
jgi:hypothetical protein